MKNFIMTGSDSHYLKLLINLGITILVQQNRHHVPPGCDKGGSTVVVQLLMWFDSLRTMDYSMPVNTYEVFLGEKSEYKLNQTPKYN